MPFLSRRRLKWVGKRSYKHVVPGSANRTSAATNLEHDLAEATDTPDLATVQEVAAFSRIENIFLDLNITNTTTNEDHIVDWYLAKKLPGQTMSSPASVGASNVKAQVFQEGRECLRGSNVVKRIGYIRVPPKLARMNDGDKIVLVLINPGADATNTWTYCFKAIYKEVRA